MALKSEAELGSALDRLIQAGLLSRQGSPPQASYLFKHAHGAGRRLWHAAARASARASRPYRPESLERQFGQTAESQPQIAGGASLHPELG